MKWSTIPEDVEVYLHRNRVPFKVANIDKEPDVFPEESVIVTGVARSEENKLLFVESNKEGRDWEFPSGRIEDGETPEGTIHREFIEETGFRVEDAVPVVALVWSLPSRTFIQVVFAVEVGEKVEEIGDEVRNVEWFDSIPEHVTHGDVGRKTHELIANEVRNGAPEGVERWIQRAKRVAEKHESKVAAGVVATGVVASVFSKFKSDDGEPE